MKNIKSIFLLLFIFALITAYPTLAEDFTNITVSPSNFVVLENDLGKKMEITINNPSSADAKMTIEECIAEKINREYVKSSEEMIKSSIEIDNTEITVKAKSELVVITRVRISASGGTQIACVKIAPKDLASNTTNTIPTTIIPYLIQNFKGEQKIDITMDIGISGIATSTDITIRGTINNIGDKFFTPKGSIIISKGGTKLQEIEITSQIPGLMLPGESKSFEVKWTNTLDTITSIGEYQIDARISTDQSGTSTVKQVTYTYIPTDVILLVSILVGALLLIIIGVIVLKKR